MSRFALARLRSRVAAIMAGEAEVPKPRPVVRIPGTLSLRLA